MKKHRAGSGKRAQWVRAAFPDYSSSVPSTHTRWLTTTLALRDPTTPSGLSKHLHMHTYTIKNKRNL